MGRDGSGAVHPGSGKPYSEELAMAEVVSSEGRVTASEAMRDRLGTAPGSFVEFKGCVADTLWALNARATGWGGPAGLRVGAG